MCYHVQFGSSAANGVRINRKESQKLGVGQLDPTPFEWGMADHLKQTQSPYALQHQIC